MKFKISFKAIFWWIFKIKCPRKHAGFKPKCSSGSVDVSLWSVLFFYDSLRTCFPFISESATTESLEEPKIQTHLWQKKTADQSDCGQSAVLCGENLLLRLQHRSSLWDCDVSGRGVVRKGLVDEEDHEMDKDFKQIHEKLKTISEKNKQTLRQIRIDEINENYG